MSLSTLFLLQLSYVHTCKVEIVLHTLQYIDYKYYEHLSVICKIFLRDRDNYRKLKLKLRT